MTERPAPTRLPSGTGTGTARARSLRIEEPPERRPLLPRRATFTHALDHEVFSCYTTGHSTLPIYTNIHRIRRDIISVVEDYLSLDQLRDMRINVSVVRPLVDKFYEQDDISIGVCPLHDAVPRGCPNTDAQSTACWSTALSSSTSSLISTIVKMSTTPGRRCASSSRRAS